MSKLVRLRTRFAPAQTRTVLFGSGGAGVYTCILVRKLTLFDIGLVAPLKTKKTLRLQQQY